MCSVCSMQFFITCKRVKRKHSPNSPKVKKNTETAYYFCGEKSAVSGDYGERWGNYTNGVENAANARLAGSDKVSG